MAMPPDEPKSPEQVQQWVEKHTREHDRFAHVAAKYDDHRATHGCYDVYPYPNGSLLGTLAATHRAQRILEVGCGLGYSALWFAYGGGPGTVVESVERDPEHAAIAFISGPAAKRIFAFRPNFLLNAASSSDSVFCPPKVCAPAMKVNSGSFFAAAISWSSVSAAMAE